MLLITLAIAAYHVLVLGAIAATIICLFSYLGDGGPLAVDGSLLGARHPLSILHVRLRRDTGGAGHASGALLESLHSCESSTTAPTH